MVELSTPVKLWDFPRNSRLQSKGCRFNSCPFHLYFFSNSTSIRIKVDTVITV